MRMNCDFNEHYLGIIYVQILLIHRVNKNGSPRNNYKLERQSIEMKPVKMRNEVSEKIILEILSSNRNVLPRLLPDDPCRTTEKDLGLPGPTPNFTPKLHF